MDYVAFILVCLALYCPFFTLIALVTPWKGFAVFSVKHRHRQYRAVHLALFDRVGTMNRRRARRYHQAFVQALEEALTSRPVRPVFFRSHLMRPAQVALACQVLSHRDEYRCRIVHLTLPRWERTAIFAQMLLQEWRFVRLPPAQAVMVVIYRLPE
ncbi:TPA_asm: hypothetical protein G1X19_11225 [Salmonella enterica subsp. enterica serovar Typhimurium str. SL1344]|uniref:Uncharacterized protein n=1 Tax=Salmonella typhimurium (strain SL1344) TaxID=216597 RepID=A0A718W847_SALTS|nr:hypothetical protein [Salmonella enterica]EDU9586145.1 hypothetical protein [Salmonella enterica subsp. enterica serovar Kisangani]HAD6674498.1 hypothetical protein [Salmonella enterica subsp. enterica serovar Typhimurium str. SL1344]EEF2419706.1 hypothetical protein [Salmonella enterica]EJH1054480.1 hypothetical protein [Salmonella enterica]